METIARYTKCAICQRNQPRELLAVLGLDVASVCLECGLKLASNGVIVYNYFTGETLGGINFMVNPNLKIRGGKVTNRVICLEGIWRNFIEDPYITEEDFEKEIVNTIVHETLHNILRQIMDVKGNNYWAHEWMIDTLLEDWEDPEWIDRFEEMREKSLGEQTSGGGA